jgi:predicted phage tail protein
VDGSTAQNYGRCKQRKNRRHDDAQSYTEVIDAKLRYPNTALLYIEFDSSQFNGSVPQISCEPYMRVIRVPDNYDPETRTYSGTWQGGLSGRGRITRHGFL